MTRTTQTPKLQLSKKAKYTSSLSKDEENPLKKNMRL